LRFEDIARIVESVVYAPRHVVVGVTASSKLVVMSTLDGSMKLYAYSDGSLKKLSDRVVHLFAVVKHVSDYVVFSVDVSSGRELSKLFALDLPSGREYDVFGSVELQRIVDVGFDDRRVAWSGAS